MGDEREGTVRRRKTGRESWDHAGAKWSVAITLHELGFKVFREPELQVKGRTVRPDLVAIKGHGAIIVEIGQLQPRPLRFEDLYQAVQQKYKEFTVRHVIFCNPMIKQFDYLVNLDPSDIPQIMAKIDQREKPDRKLHLRRET